MAQMFVIDFKNKVIAFDLENPQHQKWYREDKTLDKETVLNFMELPEEIKKLADKNPTVGFSFDTETVFFTDCLSKYATFEEWMKKPHRNEVSVQGMNNHYDDFLKAIDYTDCDAHGMICKLDDMMEACFPEDSDK